jgi:hypothetical protein
MAYKQIQGRSEFPKTGRGITSKLAGPAPTTSGSSYNNFIDSTASYLKGEQGLIPDSITGGKPTRKAIGDGIRKVANSIDPKRKSLQPGPKASKVSKPNKPSKGGDKKALVDKKPYPNVKQSKSGPKSNQEYKASQEAKFVKALEEGIKKDRNKKSYPNVDEGTRPDAKKTKLKK